MTGAALRMSELPLGETVAEALANLLAHRQRSALALLGIVIGSAAIVAMLAIGHMAQRETLKLFSHMGVNMIQVHASPAGDAEAVLDVTTIAGLPRTDPDVVAAAPVARSLTGPTSAPRPDLADLGLAAVTLPIRLVGLDTSQGRMFSLTDDNASVATLAAGGADALLGSSAWRGDQPDPRARGYVYTVIGILGAGANTSLDLTDFNSSVSTSPPLAPGGWSIRPSRRRPCFASARGPTPRPRANASRPRSPTPPRRCRC